MFLGFDRAFHPSLPMRQARHEAQTRAKLEPCIETTSCSDEYRVALSAPNGAGVSQCSACVQGDMLILEGLIAPQIKYVCTRHAGLYAQPNERALVEVIRPRTVVCGSLPTRSCTGWIQLEGQGGWMIADDVEPLSPTSQLTRRRFAKRVDLPADAILDAATENDEGNQYIVRVPRRPKPVAARAPVRKADRTQNAASKETGAQDSPQASAPRVPGWVSAIQAECFAEGVTVPPMVSTWSADEVRAYFESGGKRWPARGMTPPKAQLHSSAKVPTKKAAVDLKSKGALGQVKLPQSEPVLVECTANLVNVQAPSETYEFWDAISGGGFAPAPQPPAYARDM